MQGSGQEKQTQTDAGAFESNSVRAGDCDLGQPPRLEIRHRLRKFPLAAIYCFLGLSILLSTIFRASANASVGVEHGFVAASFNLSSSYTVTMNPVWRVRSSR